ncbi:MAG: ABC transporter substrate-binding protein [Gammaproteobacteria bacterium]|nr:ABC transporter substrate-binding protein [Gammaproteobacteria bacterium]
MKNIKVILLGLAVVVVLVVGVRLLIVEPEPVATSEVKPEPGATPTNTFVVAKDIADIITMDPAEVFELTTGEIIANIYDRIMMFEPEDLQNLVGGVVESWEVAKDGKTITFKVRSGLKFHSGNPVRAEDVAWSLQRVVKLNKTPAFIITQFGWSADNVDGLVKATDDSHVQITITEEFSPGLVLNALSAGVASVVDKKLAMSHEKDGDLGYDWLKSNSAGSGAFSLKTWKANEVVTLQAHAGYRHGMPGMERVILRHVAEPSSQRLLLEKGDIDMARNLTPDQIKGVSDNSDIVVDDYPKGAIVYMAANGGHPILGKQEIVQAIRHLVDYDSMANSFLAGQFVVHQAFWPAGLWASLETIPYKQDVAKAKALLASAGHAGRPCARHRR